MDYAMVGKFLLDQARQRAVGDGIFLWDLTCSLPVAPDIEASLRIAMQDWEGETVELYESCWTKKRKDPRGKHSLNLVRGKPVHLPELPEMLFAVYTDPDSRFHWRVTEISSGYAMSSNKASEAAAIEAVKTGIKRLGPKYIRDAVRSARDYQANAHAKNWPATASMTPVSPEVAAMLQGRGIKVNAGDII